MSFTGVGDLSAPPDGFSTCYVVPQVLTQYLSQLLASAPWWSAAHRPPTGSSVDLAPRSKWFRFILSPLSAVSRA